MKSIPYNGKKSPAMSSGYQRKATCTVTVPLGLHSHKDDGGVWLGCRCHADRPLRIFVRSTYLCYDAMSMCCVVLCRVYMKPSLSSSLDIHLYISETLFLTYLPTTISSTSQYQQQIPLYNTRASTVYHQNFHHQITYRLSCFVIVEPNHLLKKRKMSDLHMTIDDPERVRPPSIT